MNNWYVLRVRVPATKDEYYYEAIEWLDAVPLSENVDIGFDDDVEIQRGDFTIVASDLTEREADAKIKHLEELAKSLVSD